MSLVDFRFEEMSQNSGEGWAWLCDKFEGLEGIEQPYKLYTAVAVLPNQQLDTSGKSSIDVLYLPTSGRIAITNNAYTTWADCNRDEDIVQMIDMYYNNSDEWESRN